MVATSFAKIKEYLTLWCTTRHKAAHRFEKSKIAQDFPEKLKILFIEKEIYSNSVLFM